MVERKELCENDGADKSGGAGEQDGGVAEEMGGHGDGGQSPGTCWMVFRSGGDISVGHGKA